ncbi:helix-turn-helix transcriptional regulator [Specibacter sp. RAF43]|uniref:helix-turn-helix transcriptional regulator n=1 Tax=Specibacter sp. RAF43 TaxID=3233057 RepID=UPI003F990038
MSASTAVSTELLDSPVRPVSTPLLDSLVAPVTLAERLGTTERSLSEWRIKGRGPKFIRVGRSVRYRPEAVDAWLLGQEYASTSEEVR